MNKHVLYIAAHHPASRHPASWNSLLAAAAKVQNEVAALRLK